MKPITIDEYKEHSPEFFEKFNFVKSQMGYDTKAEDVLKVMESLSGLVMTKRKEKNSGPMGFNKEETKTDKEIDDKAGYDTYSK